MSMNTHLIEPADNVTRGQLRFLWYLSETEKLSKTAELLGMSLGSASRTLDKLRVAFDDALFTSHARGLAPTETMRRLKPELKRALEHSDRLFRPLKFDPHKAKGVFRIASKGLVTSSLMAYLLPKVALEAPQLTIGHYQPTYEVWSDLEAGRIDLALMTDWEVPQMFHYCPLFELELGIMLRRGHPLVKAFNGQAPSEKAFSSFARLSMMVNCDRSYSDWDASIFDQDRDQNSTIATSHSAIELAATLTQSDFIMVTPKIGAQSIMDYYDLMWIELPKVYQRPTTHHACLVWNPTQHRDPLHIWVRSHIRAWAKALHQKEKSHFA